MFSSTFSPHFFQRKKWHRHLSFGVKNFLTLLLVSFLFFSGTAFGQLSFSIDFAAANPSSYNHITGGGIFGTQNSHSNPNVVESLEGGSFKCGEHVTFLTKITVGGTGTCQTIVLNYKFTADATGQSGVAFGSFGTVALNSSSDPGVKESTTDGCTSTATLSDEHINGDGTLFNHNDLLGTVTITGVSAAETLVLRTDVIIACDPDSKPTGNLQGAFLSGSVNGSAIQGGQQTIDLKNAGDIILAGCALPTADPVCAGTTTTHTATADVSGATYNWTISGAGTIVDGDNGGTTKTTTSSGTTSSVQVVAGTSGNYTLSVEISKSGVVTQSCAVTVEINPLPSATISGGTEVCKDATAPTITFTGLGGTAPYTFTYNINDGTNQTVTSDAGSDTKTISAPTATTGTFVYNLVSIHDASSTTCTANITGQSATITVKDFLGTPAASGSIACGNTTTTVTVSTYNANDGITYTLTDNNNSSNTFTAASGVFSNVPAGSYTLTASKTGNCDATNSVTISGPPQPLGTPAASGRVACGATSATVTVSTYVAGDGITYTLTGNSLTFTAINGVFSNVPAGSYTLTASKSTNCDATSPVTIGQATCPKVYCSLTQGFYGSTSGKTCANGGSLTAVQLLQQLLSKGDLVVGAGSKILTFTPNSASILNQILPGGTTGRALSQSCTITGSSTITTDKKTGIGSVGGCLSLMNSKIDNVLLSQTITLSLNIRLSSGGSLAGFVLPNAPIVTYPASCGATTLNTSSFNCALATTFAPVSGVVNYLAGNTNYGATAAGLLKLANDVLGGVAIASVPGVPVPSIGNIVAEIDVVNKAFDGCRAYLGASCTNASSATLAQSSEVGAAISVAPSKLTVSAFPNPYTDKVKFVILSSVSGQATLDVFNMLGQKVKTVFQGQVTAGIGQSVEYNVPKVNAGNLIYTLRVGNSKVTGKLMH